MSWELRVNRLGQQTHAGRTRTYGTYQVYLNGDEVDGLSGWMIEPPGPGDNGPSGVANKRRVKAKTYRLKIHGDADTKYRTIGYTPSTAGSTAKPLPGIGIPDEDTGSRSAILIHSTHDPFIAGSVYNRWLSSVGCFNPTAPLTSADQKMDFEDSHARTVALIESLRAFAPAVFANGHQSIIPDAKLVVTEALGA